MARQRQLLRHRRKCLPEREYHPIRGRWQWHHDARRRPSSPRASIPSACMSTPQEAILLVLDHDAPDNANPSAGDNCARALGSTVTTCGDVTVFKIDSTTGRLSPLRMRRSRQPVAHRSTISRFRQIPSTSFSPGLCAHAYRRDHPHFVSLRGGTQSALHLYSSNGQLTLSQNGVQPLGIHAGTAMVSAGGVLYVLDNEPITIGTSANQIRPLETTPARFLPFTVGIWRLAGGGAKWRDTR